MEIKQHIPGILICRITGTVDDKAANTWRSALEDFAKKNTERGVCGILIEMGGVTSLTIEGFDAVMEFLGEPDDVFGSDLRVRFALIGVRPFTKRFMKDNLKPVSNMRARIFHEVAKKEALAWLKSAIESAPDEDKPSESTKPDDKPSLPFTLNLLRRTKSDNGETTKKT